ncbi:MAG: hypothetical protein ACOC9D_04970 [Thermodesulfobacteriota bacterium]
MANCSDMKVGDVFYCKVCGLEMQVNKACTCEPGKEGSCSVPLKCCDQDMTKR